jgi:hypothetical protein
MAKDSTYNQLVGLYIALRADMATWPAGDTRQPFARQELQAMERRMAVLADHEFRAGNGAAGLAALSREKPRVAGAVFFENLRRFNPFGS